MRRAVIIDLVRTPFGRARGTGALAACHPVDLYAHMLKALVRRTGIDPALVEDVITGCVIQVGEQAANIGRQAVLAAGFPESVPAVTLDRKCGSAHQAMDFAAQGVIAGAYDLVIAGGVEMMGLVPMRADRLGKDNRAPLLRARRTGGVRPTSISRVLVAAGAVLIAEEKTARRLGLTPRAAVTHFAVSGDDPILMLTGVIPATKKLLGRAGIGIGDIDAFEVNEAFAPVVLAWQKEFRPDPERVNMFGGAIALGHPVGASGVRLTGNLLRALEKTGGRYALQTMCESGGMANATLVERLA